MSKYPENQQMKMQISELEAGANFQDKCRQSILKVCSTHLMFCTLLFVCQVCF